MKKILLIKFLFIYVSFGFPQDDFDQIKFNPFDENLPKRGVNSILEDRDGYMWFSLDGAGLYRTDGNNLKRFNYRNGDTTSINGNFILSNYIDSKNKMWVGTNMGLNLYDSSLETFQSIKSFNKLSPNRDVRINAIAQIEDDYLYLATSHHGLIKLNIHSFEVSAIPIQDHPKKNLKIKRLLVHNEKLYGATSKGLMVFEAAENIFKMADFHTKNGKENITQTTESLLVDKDNNLWIGTLNQGLIKILFQDKVSQIYQYPFTNKRVLSLLCNKDNQLICGTENDGLFLVKKDLQNQHKYTFKRFQQSAINSNSIWCLYEDTQSRIWAGTFNKGVSVYDKLYQKFHLLLDISNNDILQSRAISCIIKEDEDNLWIGLDGGGIEIYNIKTKKSQKINTIQNSGYQGLNTNDIITMYLDKRGNVWIGSWGKGIYFLKKGTKNFINYTKENTKEVLSSDRISSFSEDTAGRIWIGTFDGNIVYFDPQKDSFFNCKLEETGSKKFPFTQIQKIIIDKSNNIWIASINGFFKVTFLEDLSSDLTCKVTSFNKELMEASNNHPGANIISSIFLTPDQQILIGTEGAGLYIFDNKNIISRFKEPIFREETIGPIVMGNNNDIWVSCEKGITNIGLKNNKIYTYNKNDDFHSNYHYLNSIYSSKDGSIFYGNDLGLNCFKPSNIAFNKTPPKLHFTRLKIFNEEITPYQENSPLSKVISKTNQITLNHNQKVFTIDYVGINFTRPEKNQYAYQLEGVDADWRQVGNTQSATYSHLRPGDYTFKVKATNNDKIWNEQPLELAITVLAPWWKTKIAYLCYLLFLVLSCFLLLKILQQRREEQQKYEMEHQRRLQEEKLSKQKLDFFTNVSHQFKTPLTLIINPLKGIIEDKNLHLADEVKTKHQIIYKNAHRLNRLINELMDFRKLQFNKAPIHVQQVEVISFIKETLSYFSEEANKRKIDLKLESDSQILIAWLDASMIEKIIFTLVTNAFKVTPNQGSIRLTVQEQQIINPDSKALQDGFQISVKDSGPGLTEDEINQSFQRFSKVNTIANNHSGETGIGLEVVKGFVDLHKGKIALKSKVGEGSIFTLSFLLGKAHFSKEEISDKKYEIPHLYQTLPTDASNPKTPEVVSNNDTPKEPALSSKENTILIVEDNFDLRNYLSIELTEDYNILLAENGQEAFEIAKKESPQVILTDVMMPIMDGIELCKEIKSDLQTSHIPLLLLTARSTDTDKLKGINSGADAFLGKPIDMPLLRSTLNQLLTSRQILINKFSSGKVETNQDSPKKITSLDNAFIKKMVNYINENISESELTVESLASHFFLSRSQLYRKTKALTGIPVNELIRKIRLEKAIELIKAGDGNISEISFKVGFSSPSYFAKCFKEEYGKPPTEVL